MTIQKIAIFLAPALLAFGVAGCQPVRELPAAARYTAAGELIYPAAYRDWVFLTSGVNMNYSDGALGMNHDMVDNVFVDPKAWQSFKATGRWPDGTVIVKEGRVGTSKGSINKSGTFQTEQRFDLEVHVKRLQTI